nr:Gmad2 immunoglobulin-like domain-containing protein [Actinomycetota bacterium]
IALRPNTRAGALTTLTLARVGVEGPWTVTAAAADRIQVTAPTRSAQIGSPVRVAGRAQAFEGHVAVEIRQNGMRAGSSLGKGFALGGGDAMAPFEATVGFRAPARATGAVLFIEPSAQDGTPIAATVVGVRFGGKAAPAERLGAESRVRFDGIGPVSILMTEAEAKHAAGIALRTSNFGACRALKPEGEPAGVTLVMSGGDRINVITVNAGTTATNQGVHIGSTQADVLAAYPTAEVRNPDEQRHWVFVRQDERAMVFEIADGKVVAYRTGVREVIEQDEICA